MIKLASKIDLEALGEKICREEPLYRCWLCSDTGYLTRSKANNSIGGWPCSSCEKGRNICKNDKWSRAAELVKPCRCQRCTSPEKQTLDEIPI